MKHLIFSLLFGIIGTLSTFSQISKPSIDEYKAPFPSSENVIFANSDLCWLPKTSLTFFNYSMMSGTFHNQLDLCSLNHRYFYLGLMSIMDNTEPAYKQTYYYIFPIGLKLPLFNTKRYTISIGSNLFLLSTSNNANANDSKDNKYKFPSFVDSQLKFESNFVIGVAAFIGYKAQLSDYKVTSSSKTIYTGKSISGIYAGVSCNLEILYPSFPRFSRCRNIGQEEFQIAKNTNTISAYSQFISKYPNTPYSKECNQRREQVSYNIAMQSKDSIDSEYYISNYPQGQYIGIIKERRKVVIEDFYYHNAQKGDFDNCELYIKRFPNGKYLKQIESLIYSLSISGTYLDCDKYTNFFPNGSYINEIKKIRTDKFNNHDDILYEIAINGNYIDCQEYLKQFPNGKHVDIINKQMKSYQIELDNREAYKKIKKGMPFEKIIKLLSFEKSGIMGGIFVGSGLYPENNDVNTYTGYIVIERYYLKLEKSKLIDWHIESKGANSRKVFGEFTNPYDKNIKSTITADLDI